MGRIFTVDIDQPTPDYYMCKTCRTPIAATNQFNFIHWDPVMSEGLFDSVVNVVVDPADQHWIIYVPQDRIGPHTVANVHCVKCWDNLGYKYIEIGPLENLVQPNMVKLIMEKLVKRLGDLIIDEVTDDLEPEGLPLNEIP